MGAYTHGTRWVSLVFLLLSGCALVGYDALPPELEGGDANKTTAKTGGIQHTGGSMDGGTGGSDAKTGGTMAPSTGGVDANTGGSDVITGGAGDAGTGGVATGGIATGGNGSGGDATGGSDAGIPVIDSGVPDAGPPIIYSSLIHRYDFSGSGTDVIDLVGDADGTLFDDTPMSGLGYVDLNGVDDYVELPGGLLTQVEDFTLMAWITWDGAQCGAATICLGDNSGPPGEQGPIISSFGVVTDGCTTGIGAAGAYRDPNGSSAVYKQETAKIGALSFVAVTVSRSTGRWRFDLDGYGPESTLGAIDESALPSGFADWVDNKNWLGRGQDGSYPPFGGLFEEFRIYNRALTIAEVENCRTLGPDDPCDP